MVRTARDARMPAPVRAVAETANQRRVYILNTREPGRTNAVAEALPGRDAAERGAVPDGGPIGLSESAQES